MNWAPLPTDNILHNPHVRLVVVGLERPESVPPSVSPLPPSSPRRRRQRPENLPLIAGDLFLLYPAMSSQVEKAPNLCFNLHFFFFWISDLLVRRRSADFDRSVELLWWKVELKWAMLVSWLGYFGNWMFGFARCSFKFFSCMEFALNSATFFDLFGWKQCG